MCSASANQYLRQELFGSNPMKNETCILPDLPSGSYHSHPSISKHSLDKIHRAPALWKYEKSNPPDPTPAMRWGTLIHTVILEPERFAATTCIAPEINRRTNAGKAEWDAFCAENEGKEVLAAEEIFELEAIRDSVNAHPAAQRALSGSGNRIEASLFWESASGVACRARPDLIHRAGIIVDIKSTEDASPYTFARSVAKFRYHVQAAFYCDGLATIEGPDAAKGFAFIAVEKKPPYLVAVYEATPEMIAAGRLAYEADLAIYAECLASDTWPGYSDKVLTLDLPKWAI